MGTIIIKLSKKKCIRIDYVLILENNHPAYLKIYIYDATNDYRQRRFNIRMNNLRLPSSMIKLIKMQ